MMHQESTYNYKAAKGYQVVEMPYAHRELRMTLILPDAGEFESIRNAVSADWLASATEGLASGRFVALSLPKFETTTHQLRLAPALKNMGMFDAGPWVTGMSSDQRLVIDDVVQKAYIAAAEKGVEAGAATGTTIVYVSYPAPQPLPVTFDRPFLYFIRAENGLVLFAGQVTDPTLLTN
jgi:serpin B